MRETGILITLLTIIIWEHGLLSRVIWEAGVSKIMYRSMGQLAPNFLSSKSSKFYDLKAVNLFLGKFFM